MTKDNDVILDVEHHPPPPIKGYLWWYDTWICILGTIIGCTAILVDWYYILLGPLYIALGIYVAHKKSDKYVSYEDSSVTATWCFVAGVVGSAGLFLLMSNPITGCILFIIIMALPGIGLAKVLGLF